MPFALVIIGLLLVVTGIRDTYKQGANMIVADMTGSNDPQHRGFVMFFAALAMVGALGSIPAWRQFSHVFMALILFSILLSNTGAMQKFLAALRGAGPSTKVPANPNVVSGMPGGMSSPIPGGTAFTGDLGGALGLNSPMLGGGNTSERQPLRIEVCNTPTGQCL